MSASKLINSLGVSILCLLILSSVNAEIQQLAYQIHPTNVVDFSSSVEDQTLILTMFVYSPNPITYVQIVFKRADGKVIVGGGWQIDNQNVGQQSIDFSLPTNAWGGDGEYPVSLIIFKTDQGEELVLNQDYGIFVTVKGTRKSGPPTIDSYEYPKSAVAPVFLQTYLQVTSEAPVELICLQILNPNHKNIMGGCGSGDFDHQPINGGIQLDQCSPAGKYSFTVSVINKALLQSEDISFEIDVSTPNCSPWVQIALGVKEKIQNLKGGLTTVLEGFLRDKKFEHPADAFLQEKGKKVLNFLKQESSSSE